MSETGGDSRAVVGHAVVYDGQAQAYRIERTERRFEQGEWDDYGHATAELERLRSIMRRARHGDLSRGSGS